MMKSICVYCGSSFGKNPVYEQTARALGTAIAQRGLTLIYGGGRVGLMGTVADAALAAGGPVIGIMPKALVDKEIQHAQLSTLHVVDSMHSRKAMMLELADAIVALPGGFGTFEELAEAFTWAQLGFHSKPLGLLNVSNYFEHLIKLTEHAVQEGFMQDAHREIFLIEGDVERMLDRLATHQPAIVSKWHGRRD
jgi:hypothetical protein